MITQNETRFDTISKKRDIRSRDSDEVFRLCEIHNWVIKNEIEFWVYRIWDNPMFLDWEKECLVFAASRLIDLDKLIEYFHKF